MHPVARLKLIASAIRQRRLLRVTYKGLPLTIEPYLLYSTSDSKVILHGWRLLGGYDIAPSSDWCDLSVDDISAVMPMIGIFSKVRSDADSPTPDARGRVLLAADELRALA
jgi:hypothetical protein